MRSAITIGKSNNKHFCLQQRFAIYSMNKSKQRKCIGYCMANTHAGDLIIETKKERRKNVKCIWLHGYANIDHSVAWKNHAMFRRCLFLFWKFVFLWFWCWYLLMGSWPNSKYNNHSSLEVFQANSIKNFTIFLSSFFIKNKILLEIRRIFN